VHSEERQTKDGIPVTSVAQTLFDLAEVVDFERLRRAWEEADRLGLLELPAVERVCSLGYGRRSLRPIRYLLAEAGAPDITRSALEERFTKFCRRHLSDLPAPVTNVLVFDKEVDAFWPAQRLIVELDGFAYHRHRAAFERDRARDAALLTAGYRVIRLTHRRLQSEPDVVAGELRKLLASASPA
jgi:very-short-patch-repair endonuclease